MQIKEKRQYRRPTMAERIATTPPPTVVVRPSHAPHYGISESTIWRQVAAGKIRQPRVLSAGKKGRAGTVGWIRSEFEADFFGAAKTVGVNRDEPGQTAATA